MVGIRVAVGTGVGVAVGTGVGVGGTGVGVGAGVMVASMTLASTSMGKPPTDWVSIPKAPVPPAAVGFSIPVSVNAAPA